MKACPLKIYLQLDKTTDESNCSQLIALVRYVCDCTIKETFFSVKNWK